MQDVRWRFGRGLAGALLALVAACSHDPQPVRLSGPAMGTTYSVVVPSLPPGVERAAVEDAIADVLSEADRSLSGWNEHSELTRFNGSQSTDWQAVSPALFDAVSQARAVSEASGGAFDITVGPLVRAWGFGAGAHGRTRSAVRSDHRPIARRRSATRGSNCAPNRRRCARPCPDWRSTSTA